MAGRKLSIPLRETTLDILDGDVTEQGVDVVVCPANEKLELTSDVAREILEKGGATIQEECNRIGGTAVGTAVMTGAGELDATQIIHAVGPEMGSGDEDRKLSAAVRTALALTERQGLRSISMPAIVTADNGYPLDRCARVMLTEIQRYIQGGTKLERVVVCVTGDSEFEVFKRELRRGFR